MADIAQTPLSNLFLCENYYNFIQITHNFVPYGPINNTPALVQVMIWCQIGPINNK